MTTTELMNKLQRLRKLDGKSLFKRHYFKIFGSDKHHYNLNPTLSEKQVKSFENTHSIALPADYKNFLLHIENGGAGPAYGLLQLDNWNYELAISDKKFLSTPFSYTDNWNMQYTGDINNDDHYLTPEFQNWEKEYFSNKHITGSIRICHYGCAIYFLLIITGQEAGNIWVDDRANDMGLYPAISKFTKQKMTFTDWYDEWLNESIKELN
ncbi:MAG: SMI1/KNR4 family protein [Bacteroidetes bacterium]|nr:SMI1/KNR4 family protein [Bacteroidota bacterium]